MKATKQETHRAGLLKQTNKIHKTGRHRSKGSIASACKGKVSIKSLTKRARRDLDKEGRRNQAAQLRQKKREEALSSKRKLGGNAAAPILVVIVPLQREIDGAAILQNLVDADELAEVAVSPCGLTHLRVTRWKERYSFLLAPVDDIQATLDAARIANTLLLVSSASPDVSEDIVDSWGESVLSQCVGQGVPSTLLALTDLDKIHIKKRQEMKQYLRESVSKWLPEEKVMQLDSREEALHVLRRIGSQKQRTVGYRDRRAHLVAENLNYIQKAEIKEEEFGSVEVSGYLRGMPLSVNSLVYIAGFGEYQMSKIEITEDPYCLDKSRRPREGDGKVRRTIAIADPNVQESLVSENTLDPMDAEQTWPTDEELARAEAHRKRKIVKLVPKGTSEYQAAWIPDEDAAGEKSELEEDANEYEDDYEDDDEMNIDDAQSDVDSIERQNTGDDEELESVTVSEVPPDEQRYDEQMDLYEERQAMEKLLKARLDAQFPDEIDTPQDTPAKIRFQKYRGLESFRTSPWDPKENLPADYGRIFQFENYERTRRRVYRENDEMYSSKDVALPGDYVTITIEKVSRKLWDARRVPFVLFGLLPNEMRMSLMNVVLKRTGQNTEPIKSKEKLVFQLGFRRFSVCPIFSQHTNGSKHKYERFFQPDSTIVATFYAPITFTPCPAMAYIERKDKLELVATGSVMSINPDRIIVKRVVLSGHPFKVHKRSAVVRFMFFNREDIAWFKPVQLRTKYGRRGHIKEPLGTHGHMKCVFDAQLKSQDTILLNLYKRVFPKWTYEPLVLTSPSLNERCCDISME